MFTVAAMSVIDKDDVLDAKIVSGVVNSSNCLKILNLMSRFSVALQ